jgi:hypothetical protein
MATAETSATIDSKKAYLRAYYLKNADKLRAKAREYHHTKYKERWKNATEEEIAERRRKCNENTAKTKPWLSRRKRRPAAYLFNIARQRCRRTGTEFTITVDDIIVPAVCPLLGVLLDPYAESIDVHPSLDRIDSKKGYVPGNVWVVSHRANRIKSDACAEELIKIGQRLKELL